MKKHILYKTCIFISIFFLASCNEQNSKKLNETFEMTKGEIVNISDNDLQIQFLGAGTEHAINDDVNDNATFIITHIGKKEEFFMENVNGSPSIINIDIYTITLEYADGYSQTCSITVNKK